ncbi:sigma D regulator [Oceanicoccus sagamiensis]|uniref:Regulator of sigma D n=1 Tax=Oceanicoccus sagamiensis TaxID=716816 RepID=A0A1X9NFC8_9GAMM|nr:sigma D regulator [Oceanicoccus sagamiensis]ARN73657.1 regulator of sigma D [Oceanicoccus sagamiensis]
MLDNCTIEERWAGVNELVARWLQERQSIIVQFCALSGVHELKADADPSNNRLQQFCQQMVDYMSAGHFEVYYELIREAEAFADGSADIANDLMPQLTLTTDIAMDFNDRYANAEGNLMTLPKSLSKLGETLASRFEMEDSLIDTMHESHREAVA